MSRRSTPTAGRPAVAAERRGSCGDDIAPVGDISVMPQLVCTDNAQALLDALRRGAGGNCAPPSEDAL